MSFSYNDTEPFETTLNRFKYSIIIKNIFHLSSYIFLLFNNTKMGSMKNVFTEKEFFSVYPALTKAVNGLCIYGHIMSLKAEKMQKQKTKGMSIKRN